MTERTEKLIGIWAKHETEENSRSKKEKVRIFCRIGGKDKTEVHFTGRIEYVGENVVMVTMVVDRERVRGGRGRARGGRVG